MPLLLGGVLRTVHKVCTRPYPIVVPSNNEPCYAFTTSIPNVAATTVSRPRDATEPRTRRQHEAAAIHGASPALSRGDTP